MKKSAAVIEPIFLALVALALLSGGNVGGCTWQIGGSSAPFKTDGKTTVLVTHDAKAVGQLPAWVQGNESTTVEGWTKAHGGEFRLLDENSKPDLLAEKWKAALGIKRTASPWIVGAGGKSGGINRPLDNKDAVFKELEGVK